MKRNLFFLKPFADKIVIRNNVANTLWARLNLYKKLKIKQYLEAFHRTNGRQHNYLSSCSHLITFSTKRQIKAKQIVEKQIVDKKLKKDELMKIHTVNNKSLQKSQNTLT